MVPSVQRTLLALGALGAVLAACDDSTGPPTVADIIVLPDTIRVGRADSMHLTVSAVDGRGRAIAGAVIAYESSDTTVVRVSPTGWVRSVGPLGTALVFVTAGAVTRPVPTFVLALPRALHLTPGDTTIGQGQGIAFSAVVVDALGEPVANQPITFQSLSQDVMHVFGNGSAIADGAAGSAVIVARSGTLADSSTITVLAVANSIDLAPRDTSVGQGGSVQYRATVRDRHDDPMPGAPITYGSSDSSRVTISSSGLATAGFVTGTVTISARSGSVTAATTLAVTDSLILQRVPLGGRPYGAAISAAGVAYVTQLDLAKLARADLPTPAFPASVSVGAVPTEVAFNSTGSRAYVTNQFSGNVGVVDVATNTQIDVIDVTGDPFEVAVAPGDSILYVSTNVDSVYGIRIATKAVVARFATPAIGNGFVMGDTLFYVSTHSGGTVIEFNLRTRTVSRTFAVGGTPQKLDLSADRNELYIANQAGYVQFWNLLTGAQIGSNLTLPGSVGYGIARRPNTGQLYVSSAYFGSPGDIHIIDPVTQTITRKIVAGGSTRRVVFNAGGTVGFVANEGGWVDFLK